MILTRSQIQERHEARMDSVMDSVPEPKDVASLDDRLVYVKFDVRDIEFTPEGAYYCLGTPEMVRELLEG